MRRSALALLFFLGCAPTWGEPCAADRARPIVEPGSLTCTGPPGCEGEASFSYQPVSDDFAASVYCGCDGLTRFGSAPSHRYRWFGSCEDPCVGVEGLVDETLGPPQIGGARTTLVAPLCGLCGGSRWIDEGAECRGPDGLARDLGCCRLCEPSVLLDDDATCVGEGLFEMLSACCAYAADTSPPRTCGDGLSLPYDPGGLLRLEMVSTADGVILTLAYGVSPTILRVLRLDADLEVRHEVLLDVAPVDGVDLAWSGDRLAIAYAEEGADGRQLHVALFDGVLSPIDDVVLPTSSDPYALAISARETGFFVTWAADGVHGQALDPFGAAEGAAEVVLAPLSPALNLAVVASAGQIGLTLEADGGLQFLLRSASGSWSPPLVLNPDWGRSTLRAYGGGWVSVFEREIVLDVFVIGADGTSVSATEHPLSSRGWDPAVAVDGAVIGGVWTEVSAVVPASALRFARLGPEDPFAPVTISFGSDRGSAALSADERGFVVAYRAGDEVCVERR